MSERSTFVTSQVNVKEDAEHLAEYLRKHIGGNPNLISVIGDKHIYFVAGYLNITHARGEDLLDLDAQYKPRPGSAWGEDGPTIAVLNDGGPTVSSAFLKDTESTFEVLTRVSSFKGID